tara:strand:- start:37 stop:1038 length:1002 start_codon:yes stop_codon:yes gene_type:complete
MVSIENFDNKFKKLITSEDWKKLQQLYNKSKYVFLFGHGGNMAIADHAAIDMTRLTDKNVIAPGSAVLSTSIISDTSFEEWIIKWLEFRTRGIDDLSECLAIGISCSTTGASSNTLSKTLIWAKKKGLNTCLWAAQEKKDLKEDILTINQDCVYYHTSELMSLALSYELIHGAGFNCPSIGGKERQRKLQSIGVEERDLKTSSLNVPPGFERELKNLAIDFDGVIHNFDKGWHDGTCYGKPIDGSLEAIEKLSQSWNIIVFSAKARPDRPLVKGKTGIELIWEWLKKYEIEQYVDDVTWEKPRAEFYIDDKAIEFKNNWKEIENKINNIKGSK